jgi:hypothetical protein
MANAHEELTRQMLDWIEHHPLPYSEVLSVWRSSCPRLTIWEDACAEGLIETRHGYAGPVSVSEKGRKLLQACPQHF